jgi:glycosyltransferase involved in cell wall biosynthesis
VTSVESAPPCARLAVVLGTFNRLESLKRCIESIFAQTRTPSIVYVTDAGSTDGTVDYLTSIASERLVPILVGEKLGQARAYNDVFATVTAPYVVWLSDDNEIVNHGLDVGVEILDRCPKVGIVGIKVKDVEGPFVDAPYLGAVSTIGVLNVNQGMLRTHVIQGLAGFSERFRDYGIDPDLTARVLFSGWQLAYTRAVGIHHYRAWNDGPAAGPPKLDRDRDYVDLYAEKWAAYAPPDWTWGARKRAWKLLHRVTGLRINSARRWLGLDGRDWCNLLTARYVSLLDPILTRGQRFHLVQRPPRDCPALPPDPK